MAHRPDDLLDQERVALGPIEHEVDDVRLGPLTEDRSQLRGDLVAAEAAQLDPAHRPDPVPAGDHAPQRMRAVQLVRAIGQHEIHARVAQAAHEQRDEVERRAIGPVEVLEDEHERPVGAEADDRAEDQLEQLRGLDRPVVERRAAVELGDEPPELGAGRAEQALERRVVLLERQRAQRLDERRERHALAELDAAADEHPRAVLGRAPPRLLEQPRLAHAGLAADQDDGRLPRGGVGGRLGEHGQLGDAADEERADQARAHRRDPATGADERPHLDHLSPLRAKDRDPARCAGWGLRSRVVPMTASRPRRHFRLLLTGLAFSAAGDWLYNVALLALVYERTHSATWVGLTTAARVIPIVVLGPLAGVWVDRGDRKRLMLGADGVRAVLMFALAAVAASGGPIVLAPVLAALATAAASPHIPAVAATTSRLVCADGLARANALRSAIASGAIVAGPAVGALLLAASTPAVAIALNGVTFLLSAAATAAIPGGAVFRPAPGADVAPGLLAPLRDGARALRRSPVACRLLAADVAASAVYGLLTVTLVLVGRRVGAGAAGYGWLLGAAGAGGLAGAALASREQVHAHWRLALGAGLALVALPLPLLAVTTSLPAAVALAAVSGAGGVVAEILCDTGLQRTLDDDVLGRVFGLVLPAAVGGIALGAVLAGPLLGALGLVATMSAAAVAVLAVAAALVRRPRPAAAMAPAAA